MMKTLLPILALCATLSGCWVVAVGGATALITSEFADDAKVAYLENTSAEVVWASAKLSLARMASDPITIRDDLRAARANVDGAVVTVQVETHSVHEVKLSVAARKVGFYSGEIADLVVHRIKEDLRSE